MGKIRVQHVQWYETGSIVLGSLYECGHSSFAIVFGVAALARVRSRSGN